MKINEAEFDIINKAQQLTFTEYDIKWFNKDLFEGYIEGDELISIIENLICEIEKLDEQIDEINQNIQDNYQPLHVSQQVEISDDDFI